MFIASKLEEIYPIKIKTVFDKIAHQKIAIQEIKEMEFQILRVCDFATSNPTVFEFCLILTNILEIKD